MLAHFLKLTYSFIESKLGFRKFGNESIIKYPWRIWNKNRIEIGKNVFIAENSFLAVSKSFKDQKFSPILKFGDNVSVGSNLFVSCIDNITIESGVILSDRVFISDHAHEYENITIPIKNQPLKKEGAVLIKSGAFVGVNAVIMPGVTIGKNSVIGASSVVSHSVPNYSVAAGIPAKLIKKYDIKSKKWKKIS